MRSLTLASMLVLAGTLFMVAGCNHTANLLTGNASPSASALSDSTPIAPTSQDPLVAGTSAISIGASQLKVEVIYENPVGYSPAGHSVYYIGGTMAYQVRITNLGCTAFNCLNVSSQQQFYDTGTTPNGYGALVSTIKGQPLPGSNTDNWNGISIPAHSSVLLSGSYTCPLSCASGVEQTAIQIKKCDNCGSLNYYNPECGVWDPQVKP